MSTTDYYKVLQVDPEAEEEVIQAAYRRLAFKYHPDRASDAAAAAKMTAINNAWAVLGDPRARARYDVDYRRAKGLSQAASATPPPAEAATPASSDPRSVWGGQRSGSTGAPGTGTHASGRATPAHGDAGPPPGNPSGSVLNFGRYAGWSLGEIVRRDLEFLEWLDRMPIGRPYRDEIDRLLRAAGRRRAGAEQREGHGLPRRR